MTKNIEWLKKEIGELPCVDTVFNSGGSSYIDSAVPVMAVYDLLDQLDEPEANSQINKLANFIMSEVEGEPSQNQGVVDTAIRIIKSYQNQEVLTREWIDDNKSLINGRSTNPDGTEGDCYDAHYIHVLELQNLLVPKQEVIERHGMSESEWAEVIDRYKWHLEQEGYVVIEKPTIPQFVADYTEEYKGWNDDEEFYDEDNASDLFNAMGFDNAGMSAKIQDYLVDNLEIFARAWLAGYEVEEEQKYIVRLPNSMQDAFPIVALGRTDKGNLSVRKNRVGTNLTLHDKYLLTEQEIKDYDKRYMVFAIPVEELKE